MNIVQLAVALNNEGEESLYAVTSAGLVLQRRWAVKPRQRMVYPEGGAAGGVLVWQPGWTEGWIEVSEAMSVPVHHPDSVSAEG